MNEGKNEGKNVNSKQITQNLATISQHETLIYVAGVFDFCTLTKIHT